MRVADLITRVFDQIKREDVSAEATTRTKVLRAVNAITQSIARKTIGEGEGYHRLYLTLLGDDARELQRNLWEYKLPLWADRVYDVRHNKPSSEPEGYRIGPVNTRDRNRKGFTFKNRTTMHLSGWTTAQDLRVEIAKVPAELIDGAITLTGADATNTVQVSTADLPNQIPGYYSNAIFEFDTSQLPDITMAGYTMQVLDSAIISDSGTLRQQLTNVEDFPVLPLAGDLIHMHMELSDQHSRYVVLRVARQVLQSEGNVDAIAALAPELASEERDFLDGLHRQQSEPEFIREGNDRVGTRRSSRDTDNYYYLN